MISGGAVAAQPEFIRLDPDKKSPRVSEFENKLSSMVVGQERAVRQMSGLYQIFLAGMSGPNRPIGNLLFLGPTGSGKTKTVEAAAEILLGFSNSVVRIDCAEYAHSDDIAKLVGSPPGFLGHRSTTPILTQENLDWHHNDEHKLTFLLFDEIEKSSYALWQLLLGILDKATLSLGDNRKVNFSKCIIVMTSNLGARQMSELINGGVGFAPSKKNKNDSETDQKIYQVAVEAAKKTFSPEFMNRIDKTVVFRSLRTEHLQDILYLELGAVQKRITENVETKFVFKCSDDALNFLLKEGTDPQYGARHLKRSIERFIVYPLSNLVATRQIETGDVVEIRFSQSKQGLIFIRHEGQMLVC